MQQSLGGGEVSANVTEMNLSLPLVALAPVYTYTVLTPFARRYASRMPNISALKEKETKKYFRIESLASYG